MPADIWALGILISTIILGRPPFEGDSDVALFDRTNTQREVLSNIINQCGVIPRSIKNWLKAFAFLFTCFEIETISKFLFPNCAWCEHCSIVGME